MKKIPEIALVFWIMKICATTLGETAGDLLSMTLNVGYAASSMILISFFFATLMVQLVSRKYHPVVYWAVILSTSTAGTTMSDYMDRTLSLGYVYGSLLLVSVLIAILMAWRLTEKTISVKDIVTRRSEVFYWAAILVSNTLGTALGDFLADSSGLGFFGGAALVGACLFAVVFAFYFTKISRVALFWFAFVLTRPFGATMGDVLTKSHEKGGLNFGTVGSSAILVSALIALVGYELFVQMKERQTVLIDEEANEKSDPQ